VELAGAVSRLVDVLHPEQIWVFGSHARGAATEDSDVDLLVVVSTSDLPAHRRDKQLTMPSGRIPCPLTCSS